MSLRLCTPYVYTCVYVCEREGVGGSLVSPPATLARKASRLLMSNKRREDGIGLTKVKAVERQRCGWMSFSFSAVAYSTGRVGQGSSAAFYMVCNEIK